MFKKLFIKLGLIENPELKKVLDEAIALAAESAKKKPAKKKPVKKAPAKKKKAVKKKAK